MEETTCPVCGNKVPADTVACPVDGFPVPDTANEPPVGEGEAEYRAFERTQPAPKPFSEGEWA